MANSTSRSRPTNRTTPKWVEVHEALLADCDALAAGTLLPSEAQLCAQFDVSRITVRRAVDELVSAGRATREQGRGTFTSGPSATSAHPPEQFDLSGFHAQMTAQGRTVRSDVLRQEIVEASGEVAIHLNVRPGAPVVRLERLRFVDGVVDHLTRTWMDASSYPDVARADLRSDSLFSYLRHSHGLVLVEDRVTTHLTTVDGRDADTLRTTPRTTALATISTAFDATGTPRVYSRTVFASPEVRISFTVHPPRPR